MVRLNDNPPDVNGADPLTAPDDPQIGVLTEGEVQGNA